MVQISGFLNLIHQFIDRLEFVPTHRHLGLLLSQNLSWSEYIDGIVNSAYKKLGLKKKPKFKIGRDHLSKLYIAFIRTTLEYASIVWDGCLCMIQTNLKGFNYALLE